MLRGYDTLLHAGTLRFSCEFQIDGGDVVARSCQAEGFIPASFECQIDDQPRFACKFSNNNNMVV
jgi:hypothetical protein